MIRSLNLTVIYILFLAFVVYGILKPLGFVNLESANGHLYTWTGLLAITIVFSKPSRYALTGFSAKEVERVFEQMPKIAEYSNHTIQAIKNHLKRAEGDTKTRVTTIKWAAGIPYAIAIFMAQKGWIVSDVKMMGEAIVPLLVAFVIGIFISMHVRATDAIYALSFSVVDQLEAHAEKQTNSHATHKQRMHQRRSPATLKL